MSYDLPTRGDRIRLVFMPDDLYALDPGLEGTVIESSRVQIHVRWDNGRGLSLIPGIDKWETI